MSAEDHFERGTEHLDQGQPQKAIDEFKKALKVDQNHTMAWYNMGIAYGEVGEHDAARVCYRKTVKHRTLPCEPNLVFHIMK